MASYEKIKDKWSVRFWIKSHKGELRQRRLSGFKTKKEAELAYQKEQLSEGSIKEISLNLLFEQFKDYKKVNLKESSFLALDTVLKYYVIPYFDEWDINKIKPQNIIEWKNALNDLTVSFHYKDKIYTAFVGLMNYAVEFYNLPFNPVSKVGNFKNKEIKKQMQFWTEEEFQKFINAVDDLVLKCFFSTLYLTGARKGELLALDWTDIDFQKNIINISKTHTSKTLGRGYKITTPKTEGSNRQILIPDFLTAQLVKLKSYYSEFEGFNEKTFVFGMDKPLSTSTLDRRKTYYCKLAGVKEIRLHDFRHSHVSLLINKGQNIMLIADRLGHSDIKLTLNTYSHLFPSKQQELMNSLNINLENKN